MILNLFYAEKPLQHRNKRLRRANYRDFHLYGSPLENRIKKVILTNSLCRGAALDTGWSEYKKTCYIPVGRSLRFHFGFLLISPYMVT